MWDHLDIRRFPYPRLSLHAKDLRDKASGPKVPVIVGSEDSPYGQKTYYVYKSMLILHSPYFEAATSERWQKDSEGVRLEDDDPKIFEMFLQWMCTGEFNYLTDSFWDEDTFTELAEKEKARQNRRQFEGETDMVLPRLSWEFSCVLEKENRTVRRGNSDYMTNFMGEPEYEKDLLRNRETQIERAVERFLDPSRPYCGLDSTENPFLELGDPYDVFDEPWALSEEEERYINQACRSCCWAEREIIDTQLIDPGRALETLIRLYIFADKFGVCELKDRAIDAMLEQPVLGFIDLDHIKLIYANTMAGSALRTLAVGIFHAQEETRKLEKIQDMDVVLGEFFFELSKFVSELIVEFYDEYNGPPMVHAHFCHYHCHEKQSAGGFCPYI